MVPLIENHERRLQWDGCLNVRDLGGFTTRDGRRTRTGALVRMENPAHLSAEGLQAMLAHGVTTVIDLRYPMEIKHYPHLTEAIQTHNIENAPLIVNIPLLDEGNRPEDDEAFTRSRDEWHARVIDTAGNAVAAIMRTIAHADPGAVVVHCAAGKDRTGIVSALVLDLVGVPRADIAADYALSEQWLLPRTEEWLTHMDETQHEQVRRQMATPPEYMQFALDYTYTKHGSTENYLRTVGLTDHEIAALRARMLA
jgi:protein-tyrosine phosphatase